MSKIKFGPSNVSPLEKPCTSRKENAMIDKVQTRLVEKINNSPDTTTWLNYSHAAAYLSPQGIDRFHRDYNNMEEMINGAATRPLRIDKKEMEDVLDRLTREIEPPKQGEVSVNIVTDTQGGYHVLMKIPERLSLPRKFSNLGIMEEADLDTNRETTTVYISPSSVCAKRACETLAEQRKYRTSAYKTMEDIIREFDPEGKGGQINYHYGMNPVDYLLAVALGVFSDRSEPGCTPHGSVSNI